MRGAGKSWVKAHEFDTATDFKELEIAQRLEKGFIKRKTTEYEIDKNRIRKG